MKRSNLQGAERGGGVRQGQLRRWRVSLLLGVFALSPVVTSVRADSITSAQQQLTQVTAARQAAEQRLASAKQQIATLSLQLQSNRADIASVQAQTASLAAQANARNTALTGDLNTLLANLQQARATLATKRQQFSAEQATDQGMLRQDEADLRSAQGQLRDADQQRQQLAGESAALTSQLQTMDADIATRTQQIASVLVQLYKLSQTSALTLILDANNVSDGLNHLTMLGMVSQHDQDLMVQLANERDLARRQHQALSDDLASTQQLEAELAAERQEISLRTTDEEQLIQQVQNQLTQAQASFDAQAATLDSEISTTQQKINANRQQFALNQAPLLAQAAVLTGMQRVDQSKLGQAQQQQTSAEQQILQAERDQAAATQLIQQLQAAAARAAAAEQAREAAAARAANNATTAAVPAVANGAIRFIWPVQGQITQGYGPSPFSFEPPSHGYAHFHTGLDIADPIGTPIRAAAAGVVIHVGAFDGWNYGYGNNIIIVHNGTFSTLYAHMRNYAVGQNAYVQQGQVIGYIGMTGNTTGPHLHFEVRVNGNTVNPSAYL